MTRVQAMMVVAIALIVSGCGVAMYDSRMNKTLENLKYEAKLNNFLEKPAEGKFKELNVFLRVPKPMVEDKLGLANIQPGFMDHGATFTGAPTAVGKEGEPPPALPPMKLHVLVRQKPKKAAAKKGEAPPAADPATAARGNFVSDVKGILSELGPEGASDKSPTNVTMGRNAFKEFKFTAASGDDVRVYFADANKGDLEVALVFDVPAAIRTTPMAVSGIEYCLKSFALGTPARNLFNGKAATGSKAGTPEPGVF